jgi:hypothetical protein
VLKKAKDNSRHRGKLATKRFTHYVAKGMEDNQLELSETKTEPFLIEEI